MESLSRPLHRRKHSNAYAGVFSGNRPNPAGAPAVTVEEYSEIFSTAGSSSSIPVLDLSGLEESFSDDLKPDYCKIFGGFREHDIAVSYHDLLARDQARAPSSTSQSSSDLGDMPHQSSDALKQFNMSYHKISQRNKDGLDRTTHVTQLHAVPGFTCFIDESASQPNKETVKQKSSSTKNVNVNSSKTYFPDKQTAIKNVNVNSGKQDSSEKQTSQKSVNFSKYQEESLSDDKTFNTFEADLKSHPSKVLSSTELKKEKPPATDYVPSLPHAASQPKKETEKQKPPETNNVPGTKKESEKQTTPVTNNAPSGPTAASQPKQETEKQKRPAANNVPSVPPAASQPKQETVKPKSPATNNVPSPSTSASQPKQETVKQKAPATNNVPSAPTSASQPKKETEKQKPSATNYIPSSPPAASQPKKETMKQKSSETNNNLDNHKEYKKRSPTTNEEFPPTFFDEELHVNPAAAALRKAIEKAQESIRIAKESVGKKKEGLRGFSSKSFKESLKAKVRVANVNAGEELKLKDDKMKEMGYKNGSEVVFSDFADGEKLFGAKKVVNEIHGKVSERSPFISSNNKIVCDSKQVVGETETESVNNIYSQKDDERPDGFLVLERCEKKQGDSIPNHLTVCQKVETKTEISETSDQNGYEKKFSDELFKKKQGFSIFNNLTVCQKVETKKEIFQTSDQNVYEKNYSEESFGLLKSDTQENIEQEHEEKVVNAERQDEDEADKVKEDGGTGSQSEEEKFYDVCEVKIIKKAHTYTYSKETNDPSQKVDYENHKAEESYENSSSDYDDAEENDNVIGASYIVDDTEEVCNVKQNDNNVESSQDNDDVGSSQDIDDVSLSHQFHVEYKKTVEKEFFENVSSDETEDKKDECEAKTDNLEHCGVADVDFGQNNVQFKSSSEMIHGMEIEVKEYKEREETFDKEESVQQSHEDTPEIRIELDTGTPQEPKDACRQSEPSKAAHDQEERERERIKLAVDRAIREARERAFAEVRQRVIADTQEKVTQASIDKASAQSKLKAERALVERATAEARQRALEKVMKTSQPRTQVNDTKQTCSTSQTNTESALRSKAKLEKHNRIMERAAKALAEKEKRDLLALREQAERNRLSDHLDADIKRWSTGKEGNLRALLSTLQYILGADSGWQPVSLTEIITTSAVKKAYRKATLCVHPDKLQQRGASIQQKYICEKVFDLLKAAWNRFNSEER